MDRSKVIHTDYYVISDDFRLLEFNQNVQDRYNGIQRGDLCYQATMKRDTPCPHCPIAGNSRNDCPVYYDPFYRDWVEAIFAEIGDGRYAVTCHPAHGDARSMFQRLKIDDLPLEGNLLKEYDSGNIGIIGGYCEEGFPLYYVNERMIEMLGYDSREDFEEGIHQKVVNTIHPDDLPQVTADLGDHYSVGMKYETTYRMPRKDGTWFWTIDRGEVIETADGRLAIISACLDVTKEYELQEARKRESDASASKDKILSDIIRGLYSYNATVNLNTGKYSLLVGTGMEEFIRQFSQTDDYVDACNLLLSNVLPEYVDEMNRQFSLESLRRQQNHRGHIGQMVYAGVTADGLGWFEVNAFIGVDDEGTPIASVFGRDVTEAHEKADTKAQLEIANAANAAKSAFLFNMSHDIRTPMNAIIGFRDLLEKHQEEPEKRVDYLKKIEDASNVLLSIINNVLEMARIEKGTLEIDETAWSAEQFNDTLYSVFHEMMFQKGIEFTRQIVVNHHYVFCDPIKLREIFLNVLSNAYKYTGPGGKVNMLLEEIPSDREGYVLYQTTISDTGIGISEEFLPHIFEEFARENNTTDNKIEGTGLGMPIVKRLVEFLNGTIEVKSKKGVGTTVIVTLPHRIAEKSNLVMHAGMELDPKLFRGKRILLAEDNELNAEIAVEILKEAGFVIDLAEDGEICVDMLEKAPAGFYDLILMDIQMPNMNGYDATRAIRALQDSVKATIPILAMTANAFEEDKREAYRCGMNGHLAKPMNVRELMKELANCLG
ncbi:MAG: ATP-binding protein [Acetatifactor sp.]